MTIEEQFEKIWAEYAVGRDWVHDKIRDAAKAKAKAFFLAGVAAAMERCVEILKVEALKPQQMGMVEFRDDCIAAIRKELEKTNDN